VGLKQLVKGRYFEIDNRAGRSIRVRPGAGFNVQESPMDVSGPYGGWVGRTRIEGGGLWRVARAEGVDGIGPADANFRGAPGPGQEGEKQTQA
jgi:hypothetical protein